MNLRMGSGHFRSDVVQHMIEAAYFPKEDIFQKLTQEEAESRAKSGNIKNNKTDSQVQNWQHNARPGEL